MGRRMTSNDLDKLPALVNRAAHDVMDGAGALQALARLLARKAARETVSNSISTALNTSNNSVSDDVNR